MEYKKLSEENENQYILRICSMKEQNNWTWEDIAKILNDSLGHNYGESAYRKRYQSFSKMMADNEDTLFTEDEYLKKIREEKEELFKAKKQFQDQRREYNKILTMDARSDHLTEELIKIAKSLPTRQLNNFSDIPVVESGKEAILVLADWHYGEISDNIWNKYNTDICKQRVEKLYEKVSQYLRHNRVEKLHIMLLGDEIHGAIHSSCRVMSEEDTCEQLMHVSEIIAQFIDALSSKVNHIDVYSTYGNHARTIQNKDDSIHSDNMERIIPWWIRQRLQNNNRVNIIESDYYEFIAFNVCGYNIAGCHGDLDKVKNFGVVANTIFSKLYGKTIDYAFLADKHHIEEFEQLGIESILVRSLCGADEYSNNKRLYSAPGQTLVIFTPEDGRQCTYNIKL
nr:MAG TPA: DNA polymerase II small subunit [Bacteriophage sp.]